jgi:hypothetical protein
MAGVKKIETLPLSAEAKALLLQARRQVLERERQENENQERLIQPMNRALHSA